MGSRSTSPAARRALGAYDTPGDVVERLLDVVLDPILADRSLEGPRAMASLRVVDPSCGSGNFLVAAGRRIAMALERLGLDPCPAAAMAFGPCVAGADIDEVAVDECRHALTAAASGALSVEDVADRIALGDALLGDLGDLGDFGDLDPGDLGVVDLGGPGPVVGWTALAARGGDTGPSGFDVVVGNPPFLSPRQRRTAMPVGRVDALRRRFGAAGALTDPAMIFLLLAVRLARPGGTICLIEPTSVLSAHTAAAARDVLSRHADLVGLWVADEAVFDAAVDVCAPILRRRNDGDVAGGGRRSHDVARSPRPPVPGVSIRVSAPGTDGDGTRLYRGRAVTPAAASSPPSPSGEWSELAATAVGLPQRSLAVNGTVADLARATADFRDQYYGLVGGVAEETLADASPGPSSTAGGHLRRRVVPLVTVGLIDPAELGWGRRRARFHRIDYWRPVVRLDDLSPAMQAWAVERLQPKVLVASQTRVIEAVVDVGGELLPSVPVVTVTARSGSVEDLWRIAAVFLSPPATLVAARRHLGAARSDGALKVSATGLLALPTPADRGRWDQAASQVRSASGAVDTAARRRHLQAAARTMLAAYGLPPADDLLAWWEARLPRR